VLLIDVNGNVFAFTFGYSRFLLNTAYFVEDFGLKTALNTLNQQSPRSVDLHTLEDQPIQKKSQAVRGGGASVFGIDIFLMYLERSRDHRVSESATRTFPAAMQFIH
jgi:uncharacterized protein (TIGR04141 family)